MPEAAAAESAAEPCDKTYLNGATTLNYAEHAYPGATAGELATSVAVLLDPGPSKPAGYTSVFILGGWVKDGAVATNCSPGTTVTFVRR